MLEMIKLLISSKLYENLIFSMKLIDFITIEIDFITIEIESIIQFISMFNLNFSPI